MSIVGGSQSRINGMLNGPASKGPAANTDASGAMNKYGHPESSPAAKRMSSIDTSPAKLPITPNTLMDQTGKYGPAGPIVYAVTGVRNWIAGGYNDTVDEKALEAEDKMRAKLGMDPVQTEKPKGAPSVSEPGQPGELPVAPNREAPKTPSSPAKYAPPISTPNFKIPSFKPPKFK